MTVDTDTFIDTDTAVSVNLPRIVEARDYHDFCFMEQAYKDLGLHSVVVDEIGYNESCYIGLVHLGTEKHKDVLKKLRDELEDNY